MSSKSSMLIIGSVVTALAIAVIWFHAPALPAIVGACAAGLYLYWRQKSRGPGA